VSSRTRRRATRLTEVGYTAFTSKPKASHVTGRLILRRVKDMNPDHQSELFTAYRYHAVFTNSQLPMLAAEKAHRAHAIVEQVIADLKNGPLAHLPSGTSGPTVPGWSARRWRSNLTRAAGALAFAFHAKATTGTIRAQLITVPGRLARSARRLTLHLPTGWRPWHKEWEQIATAANSPPPPLDRPTRPTGPDRERRGEPVRPATSTHPHPAAVKITRPL